MLNVPVPQVVLNQARVHALIGKGKAAGVAQHVGMGEQGQGSEGAVFAQRQIDSRTVQRRTLLTDKERLAGRLHPGAFFQSAADRPQLVAAQRVRRRETALQAGDMQHAAFGVHLIEFQPASFRNAEAMPEHQQHQATVAGFIPAALRGFD